MAPRIGTSFWKVAGLSYLQYLNVSSRALSKALKVHHQLLENNSFFIFKINICMYRIRRNLRRARHWQDKVFRIIKLLET